MIEERRIHAGMYDRVVTTPCSYPSDIRRLQEYGENIKSMLPFLRKLSGRYQQLMAYEIELTKNPDYLIHLWKKQTSTA